MSESSNDSGVVTNLSPDADGSTSPVLTSLTSTSSASSHGSTGVGGRLSSWRRRQRHRQRSGHVMTATPSGPRRARIESSDSSQLADHCPMIDIEPVHVAGDDTRRGGSGGRGERDHVTNLVALSEYDIDLDPEWEISRDRCVGYRLHVHILSLQQPCYFNNCLLSTL